MIRVRTVTTPRLLPGRGRAAATLALVVLVATGALAPAAWSDPQAEPPTTTPTTSEAGPGLTPAQVQAQVAQAEQLRQQLAGSDARLSAATTQLALLGARATTALQQVRQAREAKAAATAEMLRQIVRLRQLQGQVQDSQADLGRWAWDAYTSGGPMATYENWITALQGGSTDDVGHDLAVLEHVVLIGSLTLDRLEVATLAQKDAARRAATAARAAAVAGAQAEAAKAEADRLVQQQRQALAALQVEQMHTVDTLQLTRQQLLSSGAAAAFVAEARLAAALRARPSAQVQADPSACKGLDTSAYANGQIPAAALCPVWGAPGQLLRADAAAAFRDLSREYALAFGAPICVSDAYRSRGEQVTIFATKPKLAAIPGTSNHGWGTAADLCGGIESFGTVQHAWLLLHAPLHGWFHPAWAEPNGAKPEPWHWEFAG